MKSIIKYIFAVFVMALSLASCRNSDETVDPIVVVDPVKDLLKIQEFSNDTHTVELYNATGKVIMGYNDISFRIKNKSTGNYEKSAIISWEPLMDMGTMKHACPYSTVKKLSADGALYNGYIVPIMIGSWTITVNYTINGIYYTATTTQNIVAPDKQSLTSFTSSDGVKYFLALVQPALPKVGVNDFTVGIWKKQDMMSFPLVDGFSVKIDPRMPDMGNHSSPNNVDATQSATGTLYNGKVNFTMTGMWKLNLQLTDTSGTVLGGTAVTETNTSSTAYFDIQF